MAKKAARAFPPIKTLKTATCTTLAGTATLTYQLGADDQGVLHFQIAENSGGGLFSTEWVPYLAIREALDAWPDDKAITSLTLRPLFVAKSVNTPAFLLAALLAEKLVEQLPDKKRHHQAIDDKAFVASVKKLKGPASKKATAKAGSKQPAAKKKNPSRKRKSR